MRHSQINGDRFTVYKKLIDINFKANIECWKLNKAPLVTVALVTPVKYSIPDYR